MLVAAYRLVDYLDAFIVVEGENLAEERFASVLRSRLEEWRSSSLVSS